MGDSNHSAFDEKWNGVQWNAACFVMYCDNEQTCMGNTFKMAQSQH